MVFILKELKAVGETLTGTRGRRIRGSRMWLLSALGPGRGGLVDLAFSAAWKYNRAGVRCSHLSAVSGELKGEPP